MQSKNVVHGSEEAGRMDSENSQRIQEQQEAFLTQKSKSYWESWLKHRGQKRLVSKEFGVSQETISDHLAKASVANGYDNIRHAKQSLGFCRDRIEQGSVDPNALRNLLEMQGFRCALTGVKLIPKRAELDHKTPLSQGGTNDLDNLQWLESSVNKAKGTLTNEEFIAVCKRVASYYSR